MRFGELLCKRHLSKLGGGFFLVSPSANGFRFARAEKKYGGK
jgi:hypothetical protein